MIFLKTEDEIELLRQSNLLVGRTLAEVAKLVKPGVTTKELDKERKSLSEIMVLFLPLKVFPINMEIRFLPLYAHRLMNR